MCQTKIQVVCNCSCTYTYIRLDPGEIFGLVGKSCRFTFGAIDAAEWPIGE